MFIIMDRANIDLVLARLSNVFHGVLYIFTAGNLNISTVTNRFSVTVLSILIEPNKYLIIGLYSEW